MATETTEENKRLARRVPEEIATERNFDLVEEVYAEDCVEHAPFGEPATGREATEEQLRSFIGAFPDFEATVEDAVAEGDTVAMRVTLRGTHEGEFMGIEPTGNSFEVQNAVFTRVEDGKIAERWVMPDTLGMFRQLGVVESPVN
ncbi:ester cyclase [Haladaptatus salinisoli]|uniref:ester cyclase n=1 Tax=Haladaptatus salinisoli TaxID=2884876 RepID=UPI001D0A455C|nr:ester cyclase [Haladaptatus salinisoli]